MAYAMILNKSTNEPMTAGYFPREFQTDVNRRKYILVTYDDDYKETLTEVKISFDLKYNKLVKKMACDMNMATYSGDGLFFAD